MPRPAAILFLPILFASRAAAGAEGQGDREAEILRDPWGIPHVFASSTPAL